MIVEAAVAGRADMIISKSIDLLGLREFERMPIISRTEFIQGLAKGPLWGPIQAAAMRLAQRILG